VSSLQAPEGIPPKTVTFEDLVRAEAMLRAETLVQSLLGPTAIAAQTEQNLVSEQPENERAAEMLANAIMALTESEQADSKPAIIKRAGGVVLMPATRPNQSKPKPNQLPSIITLASVLSLEERMPSYLDREPEYWEEAALCAQVDPEIFFPEKGGTTRPAKRICLSCEVRQDCLESALKRDERFGIWGGYSERERRRMKRQGNTEIKPEAVTTLSQPYARVKQLVDILEGNDAQEQREAIENTLHEDEQRLKKFVQGLLGWYRAERGKDLPGKGTIDRLYRYFNGENMWAFCKSTAIEKRLGKEIDAMTDFFDEMCDNDIDIDPLFECWERSQPKGTNLEVLHYVPAKPKWQKEALLAERQETVS
jgi:WhiB family redox-sensing transcriptional regulator